MKKTAKTITAALLLAALLLPAASCSLLRKPGDDEIRARIGQILPMAYETACIVYGDGAPIAEDFVIDPSWTIAHYAPVREGYKYENPAEMWILFMSAFSKSRALELLDYAFIGSDSLKPRYSCEPISETSRKDFVKMSRAAALEIYDAIFAGRKIDETRYGKLLVNTAAKKLYDPKAEFYPETAHVKKGTAMACQVEIEFSVDSGQTRQKTTIKMVKEHDKWFFDADVY